MTHLITAGLTGVGGAVLVASNLGPVGWILLAVGAIWLWRRC